MHDVLDRRRRHRAGGAAEDGRGQEVAHGDQPGRVDPFTLQGAQPRRDPRFVPTAEEDGFWVEAHVGVLEVSDAVGGLERWRVAGVGAAGRDVVVVGEAGPSRRTRAVGDLQHLSPLQERARVEVIGRPTRSTVTSMSTGPGRGIAVNWAAKLRGERDGSSTAAVMALATIDAV